MKTHEFFPNPQFARQRAKGRNPSSGTAVLVYVDTDNKKIRLCRKFWSHHLRKWVTRENDRFTISWGRGIEVYHIAGYIVSPPCNISWSPQKLLYSDWNRNTVNAPGYLVYAFNALRAELGLKKLPKRCPIKRFYQEYWAMVRPRTRGLEISTGIIPKPVRSPFTCGSLRKGLRKDFGTACKSMVLLYLHCLKAGFGFPMIRMGLLHPRIKRMGHLVSQIWHSNDRYCMPGSSSYPLRLAQRDLKSIDDHFPRWLDILPKKMVPSLLMSSSWWIEDTLRMLQDSEIDPSTFSSIDELHHHLVTESRSLRDKRARERLKKSFALPKQWTFLQKRQEHTKHGLLQIRMPETFLELYEWGRKMHHCIYGLASSFEEHQLILLGVFLDQKLRYNISIRPDGEDGFLWSDEKDCPWKIQQFHGACNSKPDPNHRELVLDTLNRWWKESQNLAVSA